MNEKEKQNLQNWDRIRTGGEAETHQKLWDLTGDFGRGYTPDVDAGLDRLHAKLAQEPRTAKRLTMRPRRSWLRIAAVLVGIGLFGAWWYQQQTAAPDWIVVATSPGEQRELVLPDGSEIILNENTRLSYRADLATANTRELSLRGEAYFDVVRAPEQPFVITTPQVDVRVLGTAFNLRALAEEQSAELAVTHGRVAFKPHSATEAMIVEKGGLARWAADAPVQLQKAQPTDNYRAWYSRTLQFTNTPLVEVLELLSRTYQLTFDTSEAPTIDDCQLSGHWEQISAPEAVALLELQTGLQAEATGEGRYSLRGGCK